MSSLFRALFTGTTKHKKLSEEWATIREPVVEGVTFYCKYLGSTLVDDPKGETATAEAIKRVIQTAKQVARKPERVALHVSLHGIRMEDAATSRPLLQTSIYKISYCSADAHYDHVFAFIATNDNDTCECHAFLCPKRKMAQAVTISIAQAFNLAYDYWKMSMENKEDGEIYGQEELPAEVTVGSTVVHTSSQTPTSQPSSQTSSPIPIHSDLGSLDISTSGYQSSTQALLIDLEDSTEQSTTGSPATCQPLPEIKVSTLNKPPNAFDDFSDISDGFSRLALRRENSPHPLPGRSQLGWEGLDLAVFTAPQQASPTESGFWPSTSPPLASSPSDTWCLSQSPGESRELYSKSPNTAFLHSCQSPPSPPFLFPSSYQAAADNKSDQNTASSYGNDPFFQFDSVKVSAEICKSSLMKHQSVSGDTAHSCTSGTSGKDSPFLPLAKTNPFAPDVTSMDSSPNNLAEKAKVVGTPAVNGCSSARPPWEGDVFTGRESSNVLCS